MPDFRPLVPDAALFGELLEAAPDAIVVVDAGGRMVLVNAQTERLFGYTRDELLGRPVEDLVPERFRHGHGHQRDRYTASPTARPMGAGLDLRGRHKDGREFPVEISLSPLRTPHGLLVASAIRDLTDRKRAEEERARLLQERAITDETNRLKDEFLATLSHELRTPLNAILGYARMLRSGALNADRVPRAIETIEWNATALTRLVADVLDLSRIITGKLRVEVQACDIGGIVGRAVDALQPAIDAKQLRVVKRLDREAGPVAGDPERLQQVFWNIMSNAVKFTPRGGRIDVQVARVRAQAEITVRDTGIGIPLDFLPHLFERFRQADSRLAREFGGLGLGLSLVRQFVELHGGTVAAFSEGPGTGATIVVRLPLMAVHSAAVRERRVEPGAGAAPAITLGGIRVLAIDDDADALCLLSDVLGSAGAAVDTAATAMEALAQVARQRPDVIVCDIGMPAMDGYEFIRALRAAGNGERRIPAAALTAYARSEDRARALTAGYQIHLAKPIDPQELVAAVQALSRG